LRYLVIIVFILALAALSVSCTPAAATLTTPATSPTATSTGPTFGQLAEAGRTVYMNSCALCHGQNGQGATAPAVIGSSANLQKFNSARGLLDYISTTMPATAPGSLSPQNYLNVLGFLLLQNNYVPDNTTFDSSQLDTIQLE